MILLSSAGTALICEVAHSVGGYLGCFRNFVATADHMVNRYPRVAVIGAGTRGEFREEDQMCCAWIAERLMESGYRPEDRRTLEIVRRWSGKPVDACLISGSVEYLRRSRQEEDLDFILSHVNDLRSAAMVVNDEVMMTMPSQRRILQASAHAAYSIR
jgi:2-phosphosulfolactate phosphatase